MSIQISKNIKYYRKLKDYTQDELAQCIGISAQSISKWERGEGFPDITLLPTIAAVFDVSLDELFGAKDSQNEKHLEEIKMQYNENSASGRISENIKLLREELKNFPNNFDLMVCLADSLNSEQSDKMQENRLEAAELCEFVLNKCDDTGIRNHATNSLCYIYFYLGEYDKSIKLTEKMPSLFESQEIVRAGILKNGKEKIIACKELLPALANAMKNQLYSLSWLAANSEQNYTAEECVKLLDIALAVYGLIFDDGDYLFHNCDLWLLHEQKASILLKSGDKDRALDSLCEAVCYAKQYGNLPETAFHTSVAVRGLEYNRLNTSTNTESNQCHRLLETLENKQWDLLRSDNRFVEITKELKKYAN